MAFEGAVLNRPSEGKERPVSTALMLSYSGVYSLPPAELVQSPNGDGVDEEQLLSFKIVRPSSVAVTLTAPDGTPAFQENVQREPGSYQVPFPPPSPPPPPPPEGQPPPPPVDPPPLAEGRWTLTVVATDDEAQVSSTTRRFWVNSTLGFLRVQPRTLFLPPRGRTATIQWTQTRPAQITATVETPGGIVVRMVAKRRFEPGQASIVWDGRQRDKSRAFSGLYRIRVAARNELGSVSLEQPLRVRRVAGPK